MWCGGQNDRKNFSPITLPWQLWPNQLSAMFLHTLLASRRWEEIRVGNRRFLMILTSLDSLLILCLLLEKEIVHLHHYNFLLPGFLWKLTANFFDQAISEQGNICFSCCLKTLKKTIGDFSPKAKVGRIFFQITQCTANASQKVILGDRNGIKL